MASLCSARSMFAGKQMAFQPARAVAPSTRMLVPTVEASKRCELTGKKRNKANAVCFSNKKNRKWQEPNLQQKKVFWSYGQRWVSLKLCTKAIKSIEKNGLDAMAAEAGIDLWKLPFVDARPERLQYLAENAGKVPVAVNPRCAQDSCSAYGKSGWHRKLLGTLLHHAAPCTCACCATESSMRCAWHESAVLCTLLQLLNLSAHPLCYAGVACTGMSLENSTCVQCCPYRLQGHEEP